VQLCISGIQIIAKNTTNAFLDVGYARVFFDGDGVSETSNTFRLSNNDWTPSINYINPLTLKP